MSALPTLPTKSRKDDGFTLIELLVVVVIIGILMAIAIPLYLNYREGANDSAAESDLRNAVATLELCNSDGGYPTAVAADGALTGCDSQDITASDGTTFRYVAATNTFMMLSTNSGGNAVYCYDSADGGSIEELADTATLATGTC